MHWKVRVNTVKTPTFEEKKVGMHDPPPSSYGGAAPGSSVDCDEIKLVLQDGEDLFYWF